MMNKTQVKIIWSLTPTNFYVQPIEVEQDDFSLRFENGDITAFIDQEKYDSGVTQISEIRQFIDDYLLGIQVYNNTAYELSRNYRILRPRPDGKENITLAVSSAKVSIVGQSVDLQSRDLDGNIVIDTRAQKARESESYADLVSMYRKQDDIADSIINSYHNSVNNPNNELVYLFEIEEALSKKFVREKEAIKAIGISRKKWRRLHTINFCFYPK